MLIIFQTIRGKGRPRKTFTDIQTNYLNEMFVKIEQNEQTINGSLTSYNQMFKENQLCYKTFQRLYNEYITSKVNGKIIKIIL